MIAELPPPPPIDCARKPTEFTPEVLIEDVFAIVTDPPSPEDPTEPPSLIVVSPDTVPAEFLLTTPR